MGGHGGLNILPQKRWNVYREDNREKVRKDEEAAAKEEQLKREQSRKRDAEFRFERLRVARGLPPPPPPPSQSSNNHHINLFEDPKKESVSSDISNKKNKSMNKLEEEASKKKIVTPEDDKFRLGYGLAGKGVKAPWYLSKPLLDDANATVSRGSSGNTNAIKHDEVKNKSGKKTLKELRDERLKREKREKEREHALLVDKNKNRNGTEAPPKVRSFTRECLER